MVRPSNKMELVREDKYSLKLRKYKEICLTINLSKMYQIRTNKIRINSIRINPKKLT